MALNPYNGYLNAVRIAREALVRGDSVYELVLDEIMKPEVLTQPRALVGRA